MESLILFYLWFFHFVKTTAKSMYFLYKSFYLRFTGKA